jgi:hypothetical protein
MLGIAYAKRSLKGASRGSESGNLSRASNHSIQAPFAIAAFVLACFASASPEPLGIS